MSRFVPYSQKLVHIGLIVAVIVFLADQFCKLYMVDGVNIGAMEGGIEVLPFFKLVMVWNYGISFGMFADADEWRKFFLIGVAVSITLVMLYWLLKAQNWQSACGLGLVIGGAMGNVVDRFRWGAVADFFYFHYESWYWPAFNIADAAIFLGVVLLCWDSVKHSDKA